VWPEGSTAEHVRRLQSVTDAALAHLRLRELLDALLERTKRILDVDTCAILLLDEATNELVAQAALGIEEEVEQGVRIPVGAGFAGRIAAEKRPIILDDVDHGPVLNPILREKGIRSMLGVPLVVEGVRCSPAPSIRTRSSCSSSSPTGQRSRSSTHASSRPSAPRASGSRTFRR
jgi:transcriptional regulator with GAF, ATPase, and Fis domain